MDGWLKKTFSPRQRRSSAIKSVLSRNALRMTALKLLKLQRTRSTVICLTREFKIKKSLREFKSWMLKLLISSLRSIRIAKWISRLKLTFKTRSRWMKHVLTISRGGCRKIWPNSLTSSGKARNVILTTSWNQMSSSKRYSTATAKVRFVLNCKEGTR